MSVVNQNGVLETAAAYWITINDEPKELCLDIHRYKDGIIISKDIFTVFTYLVNGRFKEKTVSPMMVIFEAPELTVMVEVINEKKETVTTIWDCNLGFDNLKNPLLNDKDQSREINGEMYNVCNLYRIKNLNDFIKSFHYKHLCKRLRVDDYRRYAKTLYYIQKGEQILVGLWCYEKNMPLGKPIRL